jgi:hypothetical protein
MDVVRQMAAADDRSLSWMIDKLLRDHLVAIGKLPKREPAPAE